jgi:hypothetical protein
MSELGRAPGQGLIDIIKKRSAGLVTATGVLLVILGLLAVAAPLAAGLSIAIVVGVLLIFGGIGQLFFAFRAGSLSAGLMVFLLGALKTVIGMIMVAQPGVALASLTIVLAAYFLFEGVMEVAWAFQLRPHAGLGVGARQRGCVAAARLDDLGSVSALGRLGGRPAGGDQADLQRRDAHHARHRSAEHRHARGGLSSDFHSAG